MFYMLYATYLCMYVHIHKCSYEERFGVRVKVVVIVFVVGSRGEVVVESFQKVQKKRERRKESREER